MGKKVGWFILAAANLQTGLALMWKCTTCGYMIQKYNLCIFRKKRMLSNFAVYTEKEDKKKSAKYLPKILGLCEKKTLYNRKGTGYWNLKIPHIRILRNFFHWNHYRCIMLMSARISPRFLILPQCRGGVEDDLLRFIPSLPFSDFTIYWAHPSCLNYLYLNPILLGKMALTRTVSDANTAIWLIFCWRPEKHLWTHCPWTHYQTHRSWSALYSGKLPRFAQMVSKCTMKISPWE